MDKANFDQTNNNSSCTVLLVSDKTTQNHAQWAIASILASVLETQAISSLRAKDTPSDLAFVKLETHQKRLCIQITVQSKSKDAHHLEYRINNFLAERQLESLSASDLVKFKYKIINRLTQR